MRYDVKTTPYGNQKILQTITLVDETARVQNPYDEISRRVIDVQDAQTKAALNQLGWYHQPCPDSDRRAAALRRRRGIARRGGCDYGAG